MHSEPVTVVVSRHAKAGREAEYEQWIKDVTRVALPFQGHLGMNVFKPQHPGDPYVLVYKFDSGENLDAWLNSPVRAEFVRRAEEMCDASTAEHLSGLETWFTLPGARTLLPPPRWKMALVTCTCVWLMGLVIAPVVRAPLGFLPSPLTALITTAVMVALLTWVIMPQVTRVLRRWLYVDKR